MRNGKDRDRDREHREHREHRDRDRNEHGWSNSNEARAMGSYEECDSFGDVCG